MPGATPYALVAKSGQSMSRGKGMRILLLNQFYKPDVAATGQLLSDLAESLARRGHEVHVVCSRRRYDGGKLPMPREEVVDGVCVHRVAGTGFGRQNLVARTIDYFSFYLTAGWRVLTLPRPDVCVSLTTPPFISLVGFLLSRLRGTRHVLWVMDVYPDIAVAYGVLRQGSVLCRIMKRLNRRICREAAAVISLGEVMTEHLKSLGVPEITLRTIHNWVPGECVSSEQMPVGRPLQIPFMYMATLLYSGNVGIGQDLGPVLHAAARLNGDGALHILIVGGGKGLSSIKKLASDLQLENIEFREPVPLYQLPPLLAEGDIHLAYQKPGTEGLLLPSKIYSTLAAGRPSLFVGPFNCEAARIVRDSGSGIALEPGHVEGIVAALRTLLKSPALRREMGTRARTYYDAHFGKKRSVFRIIEILESVGPASNGKPSDSREPEAVHACHAAVGPPRGG